jgi:hypothetical protein
MYKLTNSENVVRISDGAFIPADAANTDYRNYLEWLEQGVVPIPADVIFNPEPPQTTTPLEFIERFTEAEQLAIVTAAMSVPALRLWYDKLMAAQQVVFDDPRLEAGLDALVASGLITQSRKAAILEQ